MKTVQIILVWLAILFGWSAAVACAQAPTKPHAVLVFTATWCPACQALKPQLAALGDKRFVEMDVDKFPTLTARYGVSKIPAVVAVDQAQRPIRREVATGWTTDMLKAFGK